MDSVLHVASQDQKSRFLIVYCVISTLFCFHLLHSVKFNSVAPIDCPDPLPSLKPNTSEHPPLFPRKIWQTAKTGPARLDENDRQSIRSWTTTNQKHRYEILTQYSAETYVKDRFSHRPDIEEVFVDLQDPILRADFIRYLVLLGDGGAYSDMDTVSLKPIEDWVPSSYVNEVNLVVGVEYDRLDGQRWGDWPLDLQFCTWAILAKPGHSLMEKTVDRVIARLKALALKQETTISGIHASYDDVLSTTGPSLFTEAVVEGLAVSTGTNFTWLNLTGMTESRLVDDGTYSFKTTFSFFQTPFGTRRRTLQKRRSCALCFEAPESEFGELSGADLRVLDSSHITDQCFWVGPGALEQREPGRHDRVGASPFQGFLESRPPSRGGRSASGATRYSSKVTRYHPPRYQVTRDRAAESQGSRKPLVYI